MNTQIHQKSDQWLQQPYAAVSVAPDSYAPRHCYRRTRRATGFTLVEIAVALAIFVIGALAIVRIFPPALGIIQGNESRAIATRMAKGTLAKWSTESTLVPDAIFDANIQLPAAPVGTATRNNSLPPDPLPADYQNYALAHFTKVIAERHVIQQAANLPAGATPLFTTTQFPYSGAVNVYVEGQVNGVTIGNNGPLDFNLNFKNASLASDPSIAFSDAANGFADRPPNDMRETTFSSSPAVNDVVYYVSYRWKENNEVQSVIDEPMRMHVNANWTSAPGQDNEVVQPGRSIPSLTIIPGSVQVRFRRLVYTVASPNSVGLGYDAGDNFRGLLPLPSDGLPQPSMTVAPSTVTPIGKISYGAAISLDYTVNDWRDIVSDDTPSEIPAGQPSNTTQRLINLPIHPLDNDLPAFAYTLMTGLNSATSTPTRPIYNLFRSGWGGSGAVTPDTTSVVGVDSKRGQIIYDINAVQVAGYGPKTRTVFRTLDGWAHQISVAARSYVPFYSVALNPIENWRNYVWPGTGTRLYFHPSEAGKSILISFRYHDTPTTYKDMTTVVTIEDIINSSTPNPGFDPNVSSVELTDAKGIPVTPTSIIAVQGVGLQARTAWLDNNRYQQAIVAGYRSADQL